MFVSKNKSTRYFSSVPETAPKTPGDTGAVQLTSQPKPGSKPLLADICVIAFQNGDFGLGFACALLLALLCIK